MRILRSQLVFSLVLLTAFSSSAASPKTPAVRQQGNTVERAQMQTAQAEGDGGALVAIELEPSQPQWVIGTRMGLLGKLTNVAKVPLLFYEHETVFIAPAETRIYGKADARAGCVFFATEGNPVTPPPTSAGVDRRGQAILLQPGEAYWVFWDFDTNGCAGYPYLASPTAEVCRLEKLRLDLEKLSQKIMFHPGPYKFVLQAKFYESPGPGKADAGISHFASQQKDVRISASEGMILFAAAIGGILAFFVKQMMPNAPSDTSEATTRSDARWRRRFWRSVLHLLGAVLLSITVVILSSRLGESQFPLQVSVTDFWGALTIGFVGNFVGVYLIQKLVGMVSSPETARQAEDSAKTA